MDTKHREIFKNNRDFLIKRVNFLAVETLFMTSKIFNRYMWEDIMSQSNVTQRMELVLDILPYRGPTAFQKTIEVLKNAGFNKEAAALEMQGGDEAGDFDAYYEMSSTPLGYCLIINNVDFREADPALNLDYRDGSDVDAESLADFFKTDFEVFPEKDLTAGKMQSALDTFSKKDFSPVDCMIVVILSHGCRINGGDFVYGTDGKKIYIPNIYNMFNNKTEGLQNKPKIFFFVNCRGTGFDYGVSNTSPKESIDSSRVIPTSTNNSSMPSRNDIFIYYSTLPDEYSIRDREEGSYFIQALVPILKQYYLKEDLESMMNRVNAELSKKKSEIFCAFQLVHTEKFGNTKKVMLCRRK